MGSSPFPPFRMIRNWLDRALVPRGSLRYHCFFSPPPAPVRLTESPPPLSDPYPCYKRFAFFPISCGGSLCFAISRLPKGVPSQRVATPLGFPLLFRINDSARCPLLPLSCALGTATYLFFSGKQMVILSARPPPFRTFSMTLSTCWFPFFSTFSFFWHLTSIPPPFLIDNFAHTGFLSLDWWRRRLGIVVLLSPPYFP